MPADTLSWCSIGVVDQRLYINAIIAGFFEVWILFNQFVEPFMLIIYCVVLVFIDFGHNTCLIRYNIFYNSVFGQKKGYF
jgi:hypothetical protein